ncbi:MAG: homoaconitate hydratase [Euryarchaeota archaeon]|nr:homoaconitate hydratase [Euryarchaeota archaeon]MDE1835695.1 homoaconitate hydratase [Euryarchaeota archaeon]MDE1880443.1 homoaconitate hydratase [Euryarchaeota archaeon]MDE2043885.1 homoaconitate hydratase [Thermoplasmata archaeon]
MSGPSPPPTALVENYHDRTAAERHIPSKIVFWDETLRDGEQMPGVHFSTDEKLRIAELLSDMGVSVINAGIPVVSPDEAKTVSAVAHAGLKAKVLAAGRTVLGDVEAVINSGASHIAIFVAASNVHLQYKLRMSQDEVVKASVECVRRAHEAGLHVAFVTEDTVRAPLDFVERLYKATTEAGADRLVVSDTVGIMTPLSFRWFLREFYRRVRPRDWSVHCHNDLGLAVANTLTALEEGVTAPHTCVNGLGERAGNTAFEELVMDLETLYGVRTGIKTERLYELSQLVEELAGVPLPPNKALVGYNSFAHEAGIHSHGVLRHTLTYEPLQPEVIGRHRLFVLGKHTGKAALVEKLKERNANASEDQVSLLLAKIKSVTERRGKDDVRALVHRYREQFVNPGIHDDEFWEIVKGLGIPFEGGEPLRSAPRNPAATVSRASKIRKERA